MTTKTKPATRLWSKIRVEDNGGIRTIKLYNPDRRNAIGPQMANELLYALDDAQEDEDIRVIVLTGEGSAFCAGGDFSAMTSDGPALPMKGDYADLLLRMVRTEKPIIARVNGAAMGGGLGLAAAATFAVAEVNAKIGTPEVDVGLFPMMIMAVLSRLVPRRALLDMMLLGKRLTAEEARAIGILNTVVPLADLDATVDRIAQGLISKSPLTLALGLRAFAAQDDLELEKSLPMLRDRLAECLGTEDAREGLSAFLEKRAPVWKGR